MSLISSLGRQLLAKSKSAVTGLTSSFGPSLASSGQNATAAFTCLAVPSCVGYSLGSGQGRPRQLSSVPETLPPDSELYGWDSASTALSCAGETESPPPPLAAGVYDPPKACQRDQWRPSLRGFAVNGDPGRLARAFPADKGAKAGEGRCKRAPPHWAPFPTLAEELRNCKSADVLHELIQTNHARLSGSEVAAALHALVVMHGRGPRKAAGGAHPAAADVRAQVDTVEEVGRVLQARLEGCAADMDPKSIANCARSMVKLGSPPPEVLDTLAEAAAHKAREFSARDARVLLSAFAECGRASPALFSAMEDALLPLWASHPHVPPSDIVLAACAFSKAGCASDRLMGGVASEAMKRLEKLGADSLAALAGAFVPQARRKGTAWREAPPVADSTKQLLERISHHAVRRSAEFGPRELQTILWAFSKAGVRCDRLFDTMAQRLARGGEDGDGFVSSFGPVDVSNTAWAFSTYGYCQRHADVYRQLKVQAQSITANPNTSFQRRELVPLLWAFAPAAAAGLPEALELMSILQPAAEGAAAHLSPTEVASVMWAFAKAGRLTRPLFNTLGEPIVNHADRFSSRNIARIAWAAGTSASCSKSSPKAQLILEVHGVPGAEKTVRPRRVLTALATAAAPRVKQFASDDLAVTMWGYAASGVQAPKLMEALATEVRLRAGELHPSCLATAAWAAVHSQLSNASALLEDVESKIASAAQTGHLAPHRLCKALWAHAILEQDAPLLIRAAGTMILADADAFSPGDLAIAFRAHERLGYQAPCTFEAAEASALRRGLSAFSLPQLAGMLWACSQMQHPAPRLFEAAEPHLIGLLADCGGRRPFWTRIALSSYGLSGHPAPQLLAAAEDFLVSKVAVLPTYAWGSFLNVFELNGRQPLRLLEAMSSQGVSLSNYEAPPPRRPRTRREAMAMKEEREAGSGLTPSLEDLDPPRRDIGFHAASRPMEGMLTMSTARMPAMAEPKYYHQAMVMSAA